MGNGVGGREKVKASEISCERGKRLARKFISKDQIRRAWKVTSNRLRTTALNQKL